MFKKISILSAVGLAFLASSSIVEAKVCLAIDQEECDMSIAVRVDEVKKTVSVECPASFDLTEELQPEDENHICLCNSCKDEAGMHYACSCEEKQAKRTCEDLGLLRQKPKSEKGNVYTCTEKTDDFGDICYVCELKHSFQCPESFNLTERLQPEDDNHVCYCNSCRDEDGVHYSCQCEEKPEPIKLSCDDLGMSREKPDATDDIEYVCNEKTDDFGDTCYDCEKKCKPKECKVCEEIFNENTCKCEKIEEDCANLCFKFKFTNYSPLSKEECEAVKDQYGIKYCINAEKDYFAGAVKTCGGIDEIPTEDEAFKLGQCMFNPNATYSTIYGYRYDGYFISYGGSGSDLADHVYVWLNWERDKVDHNAIIRMYDYYGTIPYYANKDGSLYYETYGLVPRKWYNDSILSRTLCRVH